MSFRLQAPYTPHALTVADNVDRFELRPGERWGNSDSARSELSAVSVFPYSADRWIAHHVRLSGDTSGTIIIGQLHGVPDTDEPYRPPPFLIQQVDGTTTVETSADPNLTTTTDPEMVRRWTGPALAPGEWHHIVFQLRPERTGDGHVGVWLNGSTLLDAAMPMGHNDNTGPYWKYGCYRSQAFTVATVVEYANVEISTASLADRVTNPPATP